MVHKMTNIMINTMINVIIVIIMNFMINIMINIMVHRMINSSTAQGGGGSFKNRKPIRELGCCESRMAERSH